MGEQNGNEKNISTKIAKELGYSQSTVSRVIRHCGGVDSETRRHILTTAASLTDSPTVSCDIYVILPDTPRYFWEGLRLGITSVSIPPTVSVKHNVYTNVRDEDVILFYLNEAERMGAKVILLAAVMTSSILERLRQLQKHSIIFLLSEWGELPNAFFFGADSYEDGEKMGAIYCKRYEDMIPFVVNVEQNNNVSRRIEGFTETLRRFDGERFRHIPMCTIPHSVASDIRLFPSKIASLLTEIMDQESSYCLYIPFGNLYMSRVIQKIKGRDRVLCLGQDCMIVEDGNPEQGIAASVRQNTFGQGEAAIRAAIRYLNTGYLPYKKRTFIPSKIYEKK